MNRPHDIEDFRQIDTVEITREINRRGEPIDSGFTDLGTQKRKEYHCYACNVTITTKKALQAHLKEPVREKRDAKSN